MDRAFEKLGIYDFFGIWIPGALTVTYYLFTLRDCFYQILTFLGINQNGLDSGVLIALLYTAVAYIVGVILHELGKIFADFISLFDFSNVNKRIKNRNLKERPNWYRVFRKIDYEYQEALAQNGITDMDNIIGFDKAISYLKYNETISTKRIDTYHAVYALSRSLCLCFIGHSVCIWLSLLCNNNILSCICIFIVDCSCVLLFIIRTYRYFHTWVKNVYIQYYQALSKTQSKTFIW